MNTSLRISCARTLASLAITSALLAACSSSTDPGGGGGGEVEIAYSPVAANLSVTVGSGVDLRVTVTGTDDVSVTWTVGGAAVGSGATYRHTPLAVGVDTVAVAVRAGGRTGGRSWYVTANPDVSQLPPVVNGVTLAHGAQPAEVDVSWLSVSATHFPIVDYLVACRYDGPVTAANWDASLALGAFAHVPGSPFNGHTFGESDGMVPGALVYFGVRARDERGQLSPIDDIFAHVVSYPWILEVRVADERGLPVQTAIVNYAVTGQAGQFDFTDPQGRAFIGPLRSNDTVTVGAVKEGSFSYATSTPLGVRQEPLPIVLLQRDPVEHVPCSLPIDADFLAYFRYCTGNDGAGDGDAALYKWDSYPVSVWIPAAVSGTLGWDLQALAAAAMPAWNDALGAEYLVAAADSLSADVVVSFLPIAGKDGETSLLLPGGAVIGEVVPQKMRVAVDSGLDQLPNARELYVTAVALHEFGHALGHYRHACGSPLGNLMDNGGAITVLTSGLDGAINRDELRLVRACRFLPQGTDLSEYGTR